MRWLFLWLACGMVGIVPAQQQWIKGILKHGDEPLERIFIVLYDSTLQRPVQYAHMSFFSDGEFRIPLPAGLDGHTLVLIADPPGSRRCVKQLNGLHLTDSLYTLQLDSAPVHLLRCLYTTEGRQWRSVLLGEPWRNTQQTLKMVRQCIQWEQDSMQKEKEIYAREYAREMAAYDSAYAYYKAHQDDQLPEPMPVKPVELVWPELLDLECREDIRNEDMVQLTDTLMRGLPVSLPRYFYREQPDLRIVFLHHYHRLGYATDTVMIENCPPRYTRLFAPVMQRLQVQWRTLARQKMFGNDCERAVTPRLIYSIDFGFRDLKRRK